MNASGSCPRGWGASIFAFAFCAALVAAQFAYADTRVVQQIFSNAVLATPEHWGTRFIAPTSTTIQSIALGVSGTCGAVQLGHLVPDGHFVPDGSFSTVTGISGGFRYTGGSAQIVQGSTYYVLDGPGHFTVPFFIRFFCGRM